MAFSQQVRLSRDDYRKAKELEELRKSGAAPPEVDDEGMMINPHIPQYISAKPWYLDNQRPGLKHQRMTAFKPGSESNVTQSSFTEHYQRGRVSESAPTKFLPGSCTNCGATSHKAKDCCERPRKKGAVLTGKDLMPAERVQEIQFTYDAKRDRYNGYDPREYSSVIKRFEVTELERKKKKLQELDEAFEAERQEEERKRKEEEEKKSNEGSAAAAAASSSAAAGESTAAAPATGEVIPGQGLSADATDARRLRAMKKQERLKKLVKKAQKAASSNNTASIKGEASDTDSDSDADSDSDDDMKDLGEVIQKQDVAQRITVRNLRIREQTAKYLLNLDPNSAHFDPKTRSMRENPFPDKNPEDLIYAGDNFVRTQGQVKNIKSLQSFVWEAADRGNEGVHVQALPSQAEKLFQEYQAKKDALKQSRKAAILDKYGAPVAESKPSKELLMSVNENYVEYDETGKVIKGLEKSIPKTKYLEDVRENGHKAVWGSWWKQSAPGATGIWGYACCHQTIRHAICTGEAGKEATRALNEQMNSRVSFADAAKQAAATAAAESAQTQPPAAATSVPQIKTEPGIAALSSSSDMNTTEDTSTASKHNKRKRSSSADSSSSSSSSGSDSSSSDSGSDSDSESSSSSSSSASSSSSSSSSDDEDSRSKKKRSSSSRRKKRKHDKEKDKKKSRSSKKSKKSESSSSSSTKDAPIKNKHGYNSFAAENQPTDQEMDSYMKSKQSFEDPINNIPSDRLLE